MLLESGLQAELYQWSLPHSYKLPLRAVLNQRIAQNSVETWNFHAKSTSAKLGKSEVPHQ